VRIVAVVAAAIFVVVAAFLALGDLRPEIPRECNGSVDLCDARLDQVALATTHNSMTAEAEGFRPPSQGSGIPAQLEDGVRGLLVDAYLGSVRRVGDRDIVYTELSDRRIVRLGQAVVSQPARAALRIRLAAGAPRPDSPREVYLCHNFCELGAVLFSDVVATLRTFMDDHPDQVLVVVIQDELPAKALLPVIEQGGLLPYLATLDPSRPLPTLGSMVESGQRLVLGLENGDLGPRIPNMYDDGLLQDVPYAYDSVEELEARRSCRRYRGEATAPLLLLNHWISPASEPASALANSEAVLGPRTERCTVARAQPVNLVAVDFYESGDLQRVIGELDAASAP
jgi:hypothetical protein